MTIIHKSALLAIALGATSFAASADDLIGTIGKSRNGSTVVAIDLITNGDSSVFEFVVEVPKGAKNIDVSKCLSGLPSTHIGKCQYNEADGEIIGIAYSTTAATLPKGVVELGTVSFQGSLLKSGKAANIRGLQVGNRLGVAIPSNIQIEDASSGK